MIVILQSICLVSRSHAPEWPDMRKKSFHNTFVLWTSVVDPDSVPDPASSISSESGPGFRFQIQGFMTKNCKNKAEKIKKLNFINFSHFCGSFLRSLIRIQSGSVEYCKIYSWACFVRSPTPPALTALGSPDWSILAVISWANLARTVPCHIWMAEILQHILPAAQPYLSHA